MVYHLAKSNEKYLDFVAEKCSTLPSLSTESTIHIWDEFLVPTQEEKFYLILDGVDESNTEELAEFINLITTGEFPNHIRILFVGRPSFILNYIDIGSHIKVSEDSNKDDILNYITYTFDHTKRLATFKKIRETVITTLFKAADGMFLWVALMFQELAQRAMPSQVLKSLETLPKGLSNMYARAFKRMLEEAEKENVTACIRELFCWIIFLDTRYINRDLTVRDLNLAIQFLTGQEMFDVEYFLNAYTMSLLCLSKTEGEYLDELLKSKNSINLEEVDFKKIDYKWNSVQSRVQYAEEHDLLTQIAECEEEDMEEKMIEIQREITVQLRHASLGDYIKNPALESTSLILNAMDAKLHLTKSIVKIICDGPSTGVDKEAWQFSFFMWRRTLEGLDMTTLLDVDVTILVASLLRLFVLEENTRKFFVINQPFIYTFWWIDFGGPLDIEHPFRKRICTLFERALNLSENSSVFGGEELAWMKSVVQNPLSLLNHLTKTYFEEWLRFPIDQDHLDKQHDCWMIFYTGLRFFHCVCTSYLAWTCVFERICLYFVRQISFYQKVRS